MELDTKKKKKKKDQKGGHFGIKQTKTSALGETSNPNSPKEGKKKKVKTGTLT